MQSRIDAEFFALLLRQSLLQVRLAVIESLSDLSEFKDDVISVVPNLIVQM